MTAAPLTLNQLFFSAPARYTGRPVMRRKRDGRWHDITFDTLLDRVRSVSAGFSELGFNAGDRLAIVSENRPEWAIVDFACLTARLVDVPIYPTLTPAQTAYILRDSGAKGICVSSAKHLQKILEIRDQLPDLQHIVMFDGPTSTSGVLLLDAVESAGAGAIARHADWQAAALAVQPDDLATLIYTSGTTGEPKGVMLSHGNITSNVVAALQTLPLNRDDSYLSFLPLCHIFERMVGHYTMLEAGATISYATGFETVTTELPEICPTVVASVPRLYEKIRERAVDSAMRSGVKRAVFEWARVTGEKRIEYTLAHRSVPGGLALAYRIADRLVFVKLRKRLGGRVRLMLSGGAPLNPDICRFFIAAGLPILEGYGLTETSPVISFNTLDMLKPGTVGRPMPGVEVRIAADGEILVRGPNVMLGYYHQPEATEQAIDREGWFHTGDIGELDNDNCLRITDRKKDLIKTSGGKYVAPQPIEGMVKLNRFFANAVLLGDKRKFPIMLLVPNLAAVSAWMAQSGLAPRPVSELVTLPQVREKLEGEARKSLRDLAQFETPKKFLLVPNDFTVESGELTPTLKVKRKVVEQHYHDEIEALYGEM